MPQYETEAGYAIDRRLLRVRLDRMTRNAVMVDRNPNAR